MRIYTKSGDLAFKLFSFPDSQPHFILETYEVEFRSVTVETAIRNATELLQTLLVAQVLRQHGYSEINLDIRYLLGARMDRAIGTNEPFTLECIARLINGAGFSKVRVLDVHSEAATRLIRNSTNVLPVKAVDQVMATVFWGHTTSIVTPDKGAKERVEKVVSPIWGGGSRVQAFKKRDPATGALDGFGLENPADVLSHCLIIDDICDGGGTFVGLAKVLREAGAKKVYLFVTHGIFSKGLDLEGIDHTYTTDSYTHPQLLQFAFKQHDKVTVIPISMKDLK